MGGRKSANSRFFSFALGTFAFFALFFLRAFALLFCLCARERESAKKAPAPTSAYNPATHCLSIPLIHYFFIPTTIPTVPCQSPNQLRLDQCSVAYIIFQSALLEIAPVPHCSTILLPHCLTLPYPVDSCLTSHALSFPLDSLLDWLVSTLPSCRSASLSHFPTALALHCLFAQPLHLTSSSMLKYSTASLPLPYRLTAPISRCFAALSPHFLPTLHPHIQNK